MIELHKIGFILKAHGREGQIRIHVEDAFLESLSEARAVFVDIKASRVPFLIEGIEFNKHILLKLDEVDTPEQAQELAQCDLYLEKSSIRESDLSPEENENDFDWLISYTLMNQYDEACGEVEEIVYNAYQTLLKIKHSEGFFYWPFHEDFIMAIDNDNKLLQMELLDGFEGL